jgi:hypothetical protein
MQVNNKDLTPIISIFWKYYDILEREERMLKIRDSQEGNYAVKCLKAYPFCQKKAAGKVYKMVLKVAEKHRKCTKF